MYKEGCTKHEAILIAKYLIDPVKYPLSKPVKQKGETEDRVTLLTKMFTYFKNAVHNSKSAKEYLEKRCLDFTKTKVGYNSGQFHHGKRKDEGLIKSCIKYGLLLDLGVKARTGNPAYKPFGKWGIVFALKNKAGQITGLYFRSTLDNKKQRHFYLKDSKGLYPGYPGAGTKRLILTESIIDEATLLEQDEIKNKYRVLALYGTNRLTEEHQRAIKELKELEEIIFFLNGDEAGKKAVAKYAPMLKVEYEKVKITNVAVPDNEDVNSLLQGHSPEILIHLIETRKAYDFIFSNENSVEKSNEKEKETIESGEEEEEEPKAVNGLDTNNPYHLKYRGNEAGYEVKGFKVNQPDSMKITIEVSKKND